MNLNKLIKKKGFSIIELMIVIAIIGILAGAIIANYDAIFGDAKMATLRTNINEVRKSLNQYYEDKRMYPTSLHTLTLGNPAYLQTIPINPYSDKVDWELKFKNNNEWHPYGKVPPRSWNGIEDVRDAAHPNAMK